MVGVISTAEADQQSIILEVTPDKEIVWQFKVRNHPATGSPGWFYKAERIPAKLSVAALPFGGVGYLPVTGDFDGDTLADMVVVDNASGFWFFRKSTEGYAVLGYYALPFGGPGYTPVK